MKYRMGYRVVYCGRKMLELWREFNARGDQQAVKEVRRLIKQENRNAWKEVKFEPTKLIKIIRPAKVIQREMKIIPQLSESIDLS